MEALTDDILSLFEVVFSLCFVTSRHILVWLLDNILTISSQTSELVKRNQLRGPYAFMCYYLRQLMYATPIPTLEALRIPINQVLNLKRNTPRILERVRQPMVMRCEACITKEDQYFEHLF